MSITVTEQNNKTLEKHPTLKIIGEQRNEQLYGKGYTTFNSMPDSRKDAYLLKEEIARRNNAALLADILERSEIVYLSSSNKFEVGDKQGKLTVTKKLPQNNYEVECECGSIKKYPGYKLAIYQSCGCGKPLRDKYGRWMKSDHA
ncbi:hypothetical protein NEC53_001078 [Salmonella enterica]|nr:hypothetical protein [Salmonella enterica]